MAKRAEAYYGRCYELQLLRLPGLNQPMPQLRSFLLGAQRSAVLRDS
jgi:hypothetical protein